MTGSRASRTKTKKVFRFDRVRLWWSRSRPPPLAAWKKPIAGITESRSQTAHPVDAWPAKREIVYVVDVPASLTAGVLVLALASRDRKVDGNWTPSSLWL